VASGAYSDAIRQIDPDLTVFSTAAPRFVEISEKGLQMAQGSLENFMSKISNIYIRPAFQEIAQEYLEPLRRVDIDTLVLGCTHYPLLKALIGGVVGRSVTLIDSGEATAHVVSEMLSELGLLQDDNHEPVYKFYCTGDNQEAFARFGSRVLEMPIDTVERIDFE